MRKKRRVFSPNFSKLKTYGNSHHMHQLLSEHTVYADLHPRMEGSQQVKYTESHLVKQTKLCIFTCNVSTLKKIFQQLKMIFCQ